MKRRLASREDDGRFRRRIAWVIIGTVTTVSIAGYIALSITINGLPSYWQFSGEAFLLQPISEPQVDQVKLSLGSDLFGNNPNVEYEIDVCGPQPYNAYLILAGNDRISNVTQFSDPSSLPPQLLGHTLGRQVFNIEMPSPYPCKGSNGLVSFVSVSGSLSAPIHESWAGPFGWWHGPHAIESWPVINNPPASEPTYAFLNDDVKADLRSPQHVSVEIHSNTSYPSWSIDSSEPNPSVPDTLSWSATSQLNVHAKITDTTSEALLQDWSITVAVIFGVGSALVASLLFEWVRPHHSQNDISIQQNRLNTRGLVTPQQRVESRVRRRDKQWIFLLCVALITGFVRRRNRRSKV